MQQGQNIQEFEFQYGFSWPFMELFDAESPRRLYMVKLVTYISFVFHIRFALFISQISTVSVQHWTNATYRAACC